MKGFAAVRIPPGFRQSPGNGLSVVLRRIAMVPSIGAIRLWTAVAERSAATAFPRVAMHIA